MSNKFAGIQFNHIRIIASVLTLYILLPIAISLKIIPYGMRFVPLIIGAPILFFARPSKDITSSKLGITTQDLWRSIIDIIPITLLLILFTLFASILYGTREDNSGLSIYFYVSYVLILCPFQEFTYRGYLFPTLEILNFGKWLKIVFAAFLYSFAHIFYMDAYILLSTFIAGLLWNVHYDRLKNLASVTISHAILGILAFALELI